MNKPISRAICILGMHRSGTSAVARSINLMGVSLGNPSNLMPAQTDNPEGFWEHDTIVDISKRILEILQTRWDSTIPLMGDWWHHPALQPCRDELMEVIKREFLAEPIWAWKDPRSCILLPMWLEILQELGVEVSFVMPLRNPLDVASSLQKRDHFDLPKSLGLWALYTLSALYWSQQSDRVMIQYDRFLTNWEGSLRKVSDTLDIRWPEHPEFTAEMNAHIKPSLRHSESSVEELAAVAPEWMVDMYRDCLAAIESPALLKDPRFIAKMTHLYQQYGSYASLIAIGELQTVRAEVHQQVSTAAMDDVQALRAEMDQKTALLSKAVDLLKQSGEQITRIEQEKAQLESVIQQLRQQLRNAQGI